MQKSLRELKNVIIVSESCLQLQIKLLTTRLLILDNKNSKLQIKTTTEMEN